MFYPKRKSHLLDMAVAEEPTPEKITNPGLVTAATKKLTKNQTKASPRRQNAKRKFVPCDKYAKGECKNGVLCSYMHQEFPCIYFYLGVKCPDEHCKFLHNEPLPINIQQLFFKYIKTIQLEKFLSNSSKLNKPGEENTINKTQIKLLLQKYFQIERETMARAKGTKPLDVTLSFLSQQQLEKLKEMGVQNYYDVIMLSAWQLYTIGIKDGAVYKKLMDACLDVKQGGDDVPKMPTNPLINLGKNAVRVKEGPIQVSLDDYKTLASLPKEVLNRKILERHYYLLNHPFPKVVRIREKKKFCSQLKALRAELLKLKHTEPNSLKMSETTMVVLHESPISKDENEFANYLQKNKRQTLTKKKVTKPKPKKKRAPTVKVKPETFKIRMPFATYQKLKNVDSKSFGDHGKGLAIKLENKKTNNNRKKQSSKPGKAIGAGSKSSTVTKTSKRKKPTPVSDSFNTSTQLKDEKDGFVTRSGRKVKVEVFKKEKSRMKDNAPTKHKVKKGTAKRNTIKKANKNKMKPGPTYKLNKTKIKKENDSSLDGENEKKGEIIGNIAMTKGKVPLSFQDGKVTREQNQKTGKDFFHIDEVKKDGKSEDIEVKESHLKDMNKILPCSSSKEKCEESFSQENSEGSSQLNKCFVIMNGLSGNSLTDVEDQNQNEISFHQTLEDGALGKEKIHLNKENLQNCNEGLSSKQTGNLREQANQPEEPKMHPKISESVKLNLCRNKFTKLPRSSLKANKFNNTNTKQFIISPKNMTEMHEYKENCIGVDQTGNPEISNSFTPKQYKGNPRSLLKPAYKAGKKREDINKNNASSQSDKKQTFTGHSVTRKHIPVTSKEDEKFWKDSGQKENKPIRKRPSNTINELFCKPQKIPKNSNKAVITSQFENSDGTAKKNDHDNSKGELDMLADFDPLTQSTRTSQVQNNMDTTLKFNDEETSLGSLHQNNQCPQVYHSTPVQFLQNYYQKNAVKQIQLPSDNKNEDDFAKLSFADVSSTQTVDDESISYSKKMKSRSSSGFFSSSNIEVSPELLHDWDQEFMSLNRKSTQAKRRRVDVMKTSTAQSTQEFLPHTSNFSSAQKADSYDFKKFEDFYATYSHKSDSETDLPWALREIDLPDLEVNKPDRIEELLLNGANGDSRLLKYKQKFGTYSMSFPGFFTSK